MIMHSKRKENSFSHCSVLNVFKEFFLLTNFFIISFRDCDGDAHCNLNTDS